MTLWIVVHFLEDESVEAVPNFWYKNNKCVWPKKESILKHCIIKRISIKEFDHELVKARILCSAESYEEARRKASKAQYESELSGVEELKDSRKKRARKDSNSSSPSPIKKRKFKNTFQIGSPPRHKLEHTQQSSSSVCENNLSNKQAECSNTFSDKVSLDSSEIDYDDELKDPDYSILDSQVTKSFDHILFSPAGKFLVEKSEFITDNAVLHSPACRFVVDENESGDINTENSISLQIDHTQSLPNNKTYKRKLQFISEKPKILTSHRKQMQKAGNITKGTLLNQADFQKITTKQLATLKFIVDNLASSLQNIGQKIDTILKCLSTGNLNSVLVRQPFDDGMSWPLDNEEQLEELEQLLKNDEKQFRSSLVEKIALLNSTTIERSVRKMLKFMFADGLLENYSYTGFKKPKKSFSTLLSCQVIIDSIRLSPVLKTATLEEIEKPIKAWLAQAKFRKN